MAFLEDKKLNDLKSKLITDEKELKTLFGVKKNEYEIRSVFQNEVDRFIQEGWEVFKEFKHKVRVRREKTHNQKFEDQVWCQFYELGYQILNRDETFSLPFSSDEEDSKQIDIVAVNDETIFLVECKSSKKPKKAPSYKDEFELLYLRMDGFRKSLYDLFGKNKKIKFIFATRNLRLDETSEDIKRLKKSGAFHYNDNTYDYVNSLIKNYKVAAKYQFFGLLFKNEKINNEKIELSAIEGKMGGKTYYMFSIEPSLLLKLGFILHRTKANNNEMPTYQRLLVPSRLKGITEFIDEGGYFPNSLILNISSNKKLQFVPSETRAKGNSFSRAGTLILPNEYALAYIIDGQHRLYGYASSEFIDKNTIPVVALVGLDATEQLGIFMDINQNQKAVSPSLRGILAEDLFWDDPIAEKRFQALRSSIIKNLGVKANSPLYNKITIGEDKALLTLEPFDKALKKSGLLPGVKGNKFNEETIKYSLYNLHNQDQNEMEKSKDRIVLLLSKCYNLVEDNFSEIFENDKYFIVSNRGTYPFIMLIGSLHKYLIQAAKIKHLDSIKKIYDELEKYLMILLEKLSELSVENANKYLIIRGQGAETIWLRFFQTIVNDHFPEYEPEELIDWKERQDEELQDEGRKYGEAIEKFMKKTILNNLKSLYGSKWELEVGKIMRECQNRASLEDEKNYKEGIDKEKTDWTEMFNINDYKEIIEKHWTKKVDNDPSFITFEDIFSIDMGFGFNSKTEKIKWISHFNSYRNLWAHAGTKEKRLNKEEVGFLAKVYSKFY